MIAIVKPKKKFEPDNGDCFVGEWVSEFLGSEYDINLKNLPRPEFYALSVVRENHWSALEKLGIDIKELREDVEYGCPFSNNRYAHLYPLLISEYKTEDPVHEFMRFPWKMQMGSIDKSFCGHGYTDGTLPHDGSGSWGYGKVNLSDGRFLVCAIWIWYNK